MTWQFSGHGQKPATGDEPTIEDLELYNMISLASVDIQALRSGWLRLAEGWVNTFHE